MTEPLVTTCPRCGFLGCATEGKGLPTKKEIDILVRRLEMLCSRQEREQGIARLLERGWQIVSGTPAEPITLRDPSRRHLGKVRTLKGALYCQSLRDRGRVRHNREGW